MGHEWRNTGEPLPAQRAPWAGRLWATVISNLVCYKQGTCLIWTWSDQWAAMTGGGTAIVKMSEQKCPFLDVKRGFKVQR